MVLFALVVLRNYTNTWWVGGNGGGPGRCWWWRCLDRADRLSSGQGMMLDGGRSGEEVDSYKQTDRRTDERSRTQRNEVKLYTYTHSFQSAMWTVAVVAVSQGVGRWRDTAR